MEVVKVDKLPPDLCPEFDAGVLQEDMITGGRGVSVPPVELWRQKRGGFVVIECPQEIPCNPCVEACPTSAITMESLTSVPKVDYSKCTGCALCVARCPGLACFVIDLTYSQDKALVKLPYEMLPVLKRGDRVQLLDRLGRIVGEGEVLTSVEPFKDGTKVVSVIVPKNLALQVRAVRAVKD